MSRKILLRWAAFLTLFTFVGHSIGTFKKVPPEKVEMFNTYQAMSSTMVEFPFGAPKSYANILFGANLCISVFLLLAGVLFIQLSNTKAEKFPNSILATNSVGILLLAVLSGLFFFPLPMICTGLAGILGIIAMKKDQSKSFFKDVL